jgi:hypothetical protein
MKALDTPERRHTLPVFIAAMDTGARKSSLLDYLRWKDINFADELITLTAYKGKGRNIKPKRWPVQMTSRLKKELLQLQLQRKNKNGIRRSRSPERYTPLLLGASQLRY